MAVKFNIPDGYFNTDLEGVKIDFNNGCRVIVPEGKHHVVVHDMDTHSILCNQFIDNGTLETSKKYYIRYKVEIEDPSGKKYIHEMNLKDKTVLIRFPLVVMGDNLAWFQYAEDFRIKHQCKLYVSTDKKLRPMLEAAYPEIMFIEEEDKPENCYATYHLGIFFPANNRTHQPVDFRVHPLWAAAPHILGLPVVERKTKLVWKEKHEVTERYVCIAVQGTSYCKFWNNPVGWFKVVKYLKSLGYKVLCIDKDPIGGSLKYSTIIPHGSEDFTGARPLEDRAAMIAHADFFIGLGSGLSWLAHCVGKPVIMISGFSYPFAEFSNPYRVINYNVCTGCFNDSSIEYDHADPAWCPRHRNTDREYECTVKITSGQVIDMIDKLIKDEGIVVPMANK